MKRTCLAMMVLAIALTTSVEVGAVSRNQKFFQNAVNNCHAARPVFDAALRQRPLGITNEGTTSAFISCSMSIQINQHGINMVAATFVNHRVLEATPKTLSCTLVNGFPAADPTFLPKTMIIGNEAKVNLVWTAADDNGGANFVWPNLSCELPAGMEISFTHFDQEVEVGL